MIVMEAFLLGLSSGAVCVAYCAPVLIPYVVGERKSILANGVILSCFLSGRLLGYLIFAVFAWAIGRSMVNIGSLKEPLIGFAYITLSIFLVVYAFQEIHPTCSARFMGPIQWLSSHHPNLLPMTMGFATGLSFCPPFLLAITGAAEKTTLLRSIFFFFTFFLGASIFFIPVPFLGLLRGHVFLKTIAKLAAGIMGLFYLYNGSIMLIGCLARI